MAKNEYSEKKPKIIASAKRWKHKATSQSNNSREEPFTSNNRSLKNLKGAIAILTSGGDSQGMNSVLFGLAKRAESTGVDVYMIENGYAGLVDDSSNSIEKADLNYLKFNLEQGGTVIGSSRCKEFYQVEGRRKAALNLLKLNIENLVVVGGDGSLTGADLLRQEWPAYVQEFIKEGLIDENKSNSKLCIVGIIGSIDNDFFGSEMTVGADSALCRVVEAIDTLKTTAKSHDRAIVVEVMGRNCGYLALSAALGTEASYVFIPESPHRNSEEWQKNLRTQINYERLKGQYYHIVLVAEGACDSDGNCIKSDSIREFLAKECNIDTRLVVLGHIQRGGHTSAFDHLMSFKMGIEAFNVIEQKKSEAAILTFNEGRIELKPLMFCIEGIRNLKQYAKEHNWSLVMKQRGENFINIFKNFNRLLSTTTKNNHIQSGQSKRTAWGVVHLGVPMPGINATLFSFVRYALSENIKILAFCDGIEGLYQNNWTNFSWNDLSGFTSLSGSMIGSMPKTTQMTSLNDENIKKIVETLSLNNIKHLCLVGDRLALDAVKAFQHYSNRFEELKNLCVCYLPAGMQHDIANNRLGNDSVLNKTIRQISDLVFSSNGTYNQLFLIQLHLNIVSVDLFQPSLFSMAVCCSLVYPMQKSLLNSTNIDVEMVKNDATKLFEQMIKNQENVFILIHDPIASKIIPIYQSIFHDNQQKPNIQVNVIDITKLQMPICPSPYDRKTGVKLGMECARYFRNQQMRIVDDQDQTKLPPSSSFVFVEMPSFLVKPIEQASIPKI